MIVRAVSALALPRGWSLITLFIDISAVFDSVIRALVLVFDYSLESLAWLLQPLGFPPDVFSLLLHLLFLSFVSQNLLADAATEKSNNG